MICNLSEKDLFSVDYDRYFVALASLRDTFDRVSRISVPDLGKYISTSFVLSDSVVRQMDSITALSKSLSELIPKIAVFSSQDFSGLALSVSQSYSRLSESLQDSIVESLRAGEAYMDDSQRAVIDKIDPEILNPSEDRPSKPKLSVENLIAILTVVINLIFLVIQLTPDPQLDAMIDQNNTVIAQNQEIISLESEKTALLNQLVDTGQQICELLDEADLFSDDPVDAADLLTDADETAVDPPEADSAADSQENDTGIQENDIEMGHSDSPVLKFHLSP